MALPTDLLEARLPLQLGRTGGVTLQRSNVGGRNVAGHGAEWTVVTDFRWRLEFRWPKGEDESVRPARRSRRQAGREQRERCMSERMT